MEKPEDKKKSTVVDASSEPEKKDNKNLVKSPAGGPPKAKDGTPKAKALPVEDEPTADPELEKDVADPEAAEDAEDITGGEIADQVTGKTIQSITMEPKSKTLPGAQEIVLTFNEIQDSLKILVMKSGQVKFYFKGLHNKV